MDTLQKPLFAGLKLGAFFYHVLTEFRDEVFMLVGVEVGGVSEVELRKHIVCVLPDEEGFFVLVHYDNVFVCVQASEEALASSGEELEGVAQQPDVLDEVVDVQLFRQFLFRFHEVPVVICWLTAAKTSVNDLSPFLEPLTAVTRFDSFASLNAFSDFFEESCLISIRGSFFLCNFGLHFVELGNQVFVEGPTLD